MNQAKLLLATAFVSMAPATAALAETKQQPVTPYVDIRYRLEDLSRHPVRYAGRDAASSPAAGSKAMHYREQKALLAQAFEV